MSDTNIGLIDMNARSRDMIAEFFAEVALAAGPAIMDEYAKGCEVRAKSDSSPVTMADERAEEVILGLMRTRATPIPIVAEESVAKGAQTAIGDSFVLVDPLDGTREFIACNGEFTVNIALVRDRTPVAGAVYAPALRRLWFAGERAFVCDAAVGEPLPARSFWRQIRSRQAPETDLIALASRSHCDPVTEAFLAKLPIGDRRSAGSSLKFCALAEGQADVYPRFAPTMEWDTAAGDAVLRAAGGVVLDLQGSTLVYGKEETKLRNAGFVAWGDPVRASKAATLNSA